MYIYIYIYIYINYIYIYINIYIYIYIFIYIYIYLIIQTSEFSSSGACAASSSFAATQPAMQRSLSTPAGPQPLTPSSAGSCQKRVPTAAEKQSQSLDDSVSSIDSLPPRDQFDLGDRGDMRRYTVQEETSKPVRV